MNSQQLQPGFSLKPFNPLPMASPIAPPADSQDGAAC